MKILQVIPYFAPAWSYGGPVQVAWQLSRSLVKRGHQVTVFTTDALDSTSRIAVPEETSDGVRIRRFRNLSNSLAYNHKIFLSPEMNDMLRREINDFDIIHLHEYRTLQNVMTAAAARRNGVPFVLQTHGSLPKILAKKGLKSLFDTLWGRRLLSDAEKVFVLTETEIDQAREAGVEPVKIDIIPNGIDLGEYDRLPERGVFRKKLGIGNDEKVVLYLGRLHEIKGLDLLVKAFARLHIEAEKARLVIVGPDEGYLSTLQSLTDGFGLSDDILFPGSLSGEDKVQAYVDSDVFVLPSLYDTFPVSVMEACACGLPVVLTDTCGIANIINGKAGVSVPRHESEMSRVLLDLLRDDTMRKTFGQAGKKMVADTYNWDAIAGQVEIKYTDCLKKEG